MVAEKRFRRLNAPHLLTAVYAQHHRDTTRPLSTPGRSNLLRSFLRRCFFQDESRASFLIQYIGHDSFLQKQAYQKACHQFLMARLTEPCMKFWASRGEYVRSPLPSMLPVPVHPHSRGEYVAEVLELDIVSQVHPHSRGEYAGTATVMGSIFWFTPTRVGNTRRSPAI